MPKVITIAIYKLVTATETATNNVTKKKNLNRFFFSFN